MAIELSRFVGVRFHPDVHARLAKRASDDCISVGALIRRACEAALEIPSPQPPSRSVPDQGLINQLSRVGNNLNQQTRVLHQIHHQRQIPQAEAIFEHLTAVEEVLQELSRAVAEARR